MKTKLKIALFADNCKLNWTTLLPERRNGPWNSILENVSCYTGQKKGESDQRILPNPQSTTRGCRKSQISWSNTKERSILECSHCHHMRQGQQHQIFIAK